MSAECEECALPSAECVCRGSSNSVKRALKILRPQRVAARQAGVAPRESLRAAEVMALARSLDQLDQRGLGCNDAVNTDWGVRTDQGAR